MKLRFTSEAEAELNQILDYYHTIDPVLAIRFLREVEKLRDRLLQFPESGHSRLAGRYRLALVAGFPYALAYTATDKEILVEYLPHLKRRPHHWRKD
ncbi:MAG: type II toxin-antitoxin system RelE/ParE family toxin [Verrucomicrobiota bacterium JB022]|nr:type II toxin-antitoxin system RelE/ParE family toxin [Verrucomicrobiota bacterium JB022]